MKEIIKQAITHKGASFIDVLQPCVTYNDVYTVQFYRKAIYKLDDESNWDPIVHSPSEEYEKKMRAIAKAQEWDANIPVGIFFYNPLVPSFEERLQARLRYYIENPPARQSITVNGGTPLIDDRRMRKLFSKKIVSVRSHRPSD